MALIIMDECIACDACREECPNMAIEEGDPIYVIDADRCYRVCWAPSEEPQCVRFVQLIVLFWIQIMKRH